jgi:hypothetical protein
MYILVLTIMIDLYIIYVCDHWHEYIQDIYIYKEMSNLMFVYVHITHMIVYHYLYICNYIYFDFFLLIWFPYFFSSYIFLI